MVECIERGGHVIGTVAEGFVTFDAGIRACSAEVGLAVFCFIVCLQEDPLPLSWRGWTCIVGGAIEDCSGNGEHHDFTHVFFSCFIQNSTWRGLFFLSFLLLSSLRGGSSASYCIIGFCVLIVGSGVRLGLSFHFCCCSLVWTLKSGVVYLWMLSVLIFSSFWLPPFPSIIAYMHIFLGVFFLLSFYPFFSLPACLSCPLSYCTAFDIYRGWVLFFFLLSLLFYCAFCFFQIFSNFFHSNIHHHFLGTVLQKMGGLDSGILARGGGSGYVLPKKK